MKGLFPPSAGEPRETVVLIRHGWHTGVAVRRSDGSSGRLRVLRDFPGADYVEFGWGDDAFYRAPRPTAGMALKAALWPTPSVLHVAAWQGTPRENFPASEIVEVELSARGWERLLGFIDGTFERDERGDLIPVQQGLYGQSQFYRARGKFFFPKMCHVWSASALRAAGCPIRHRCAINAATVMWQARRFGRSVPYDAEPESARGRP